VASTHPLTFPRAVVDCSWPGLCEDSLDAFSHLPRGTACRSLTMARARLTALWCARQRVVSLNFEPHRTKVGPGSGRGIGHRRAIGRLTTTAPLVVSAVIGMSLRAAHARCCSHCAIARGAVDARREKRGRDEGTGKVKHTCVGGVTTAGFYACGFSASDLTHTRLATLPPLTQPAALTHTNTRCRWAEISPDTLPGHDQAARGDQLAGHGCLALRNASKNWFSQGANFWFFCQKQQTNTTALFDLDQQY
jgi:hypothetical protein